jgi:tRNA dimethylallyltransferase
MKKIIVISGPTASGKTQKAVQLCKDKNGEIISCDSRQVYKYLDIGSNKEGQIAGEGLREIDGILQHLTDIINPNQAYSAADFVKDADAKIDEIIKKGKLPIICGGTGLYIKALLYGLDIMPPANEQIRKKLKLLSKDELYEKLLNIDPESAKKNIGNTQRLIRALEVNIVSGKNMSLHFKPKKARYDFIHYSLAVDRKSLYERINLRTLQMIEKGMIEETQKVLDMGFSKECFGLTGIGYRLVIKFLDKEITKKDLVEKFSIQTRHYAKRQTTWFASQENILFTEG